MDHTPRQSARLLLGLHGLSAGMYVDPSCGAVSAPLHWRLL